MAIPALGIMARYVAKHGLKAARMRFGTKNVERLTDAARGATVVAGGAGIAKYADSQLKKGKTLYGDKPEDLKPKPKPPATNKNKNKYRKQMNK
jgi:hypothetical protein